MRKKNLPNSFMGKLIGKVIREVVTGCEKKGKSFFDLGTKLCEKNNFKVPKGYTYEYFDVEGIPVEKLTCLDSTNQDKVVLQLHGGGYIMPMGDTYRKSAVKYSKVCGGATVFNVDYRVAPQNVYPAARDDAEKVYYHLLKTYAPENIVVCGDSAGGNLTLALVGKLRDEKAPLPGALVAMSPWADLAAAGKSYLDNIFDDAFFGIDDISIYDQKKAFLVDVVCKPYAGETPLDDPGLSPVYQEYHDFPPMLIEVGSAEILMSDSITITEKAATAGVDVTLHIHKGMYHVFPIFGFTKEANKAWSEVADFLKHKFLKK